MLLGFAYPSTLHSLPESPGLVFETYLCILALGSAYFHYWKAAGTSRPKYTSYLDTRLVTLVRLLGYIFVFERVGLYDRGGE